MIYLPAFKKKVPLVCQVLPSRFIHHVEVLFIDQHRLVSLPLIPGCLGNALKDLLAF